MSVALSAADGHHDIGVKFARVLTIISKQGSSLALDDENHHKFASGKARQGIQVI